MDANRYGTVCDVAPRLICEDGDNTFRLSLALMDAHEFTLDPWPYRDYARGSSAEFTVAKDQDVCLGSRRERLLFFRGPVGLGVRWLKIIDLEGGHQPMTGEDRSVWVVFNGEIYNYQELTERLIARHTFATRSDTEVIVHGHEESGLDVLSDLEGMFAIAIWDDKTQTLVLARDRLGIKPLYYALLPDQLVFASEIKALLEHPSVDRSLDLTSLSQYLAHEYVPAPRAILRVIRKLPAGHWLTYSEGRVKIAPY